MKRERSAGENGTFKVQAAMSSGKTHQKGAPSFSARGKRGCSRGGGRGGVVFAKGSPVIPLGGENPAAELLSIGEKKKKAAWGEKRRLV